MTTREYIQCLLDIKTKDVLLKEQFYNDEPNNWEFIDKLKHLEISHNNLMLLFKTHDIEGYKRFFKIESYNKGCDLQKRKPIEDALIFEEGSIVTDDSCDFKLKSDNKGLYLLFNNEKRYIKSQNLTSDSGMKLNCIIYKLMESGQEDTFYLFHKPFQFL